MSGIGSRGLWLAWACQEELLRSFFPGSQQGGLAWPSDDRVPTGEQGCTLDSVNRAPISQKPGGYPLCPPCPVPSEPAEKSALRLFLPPYHIFLITVSLASLKGNILHPQEASRLPKGPSVF